MSLAIQHDHAPLPAGTALAIGAFDGIHLGHRALLSRAGQLAPAVGVLTFDPHPARVLAPDRAPARLTTEGQRQRLLGHLGVSRLVLLPFTRALAETPAEVFVRTTLVEGLRPAAVVVGASFRFGRGRAGTPDDLARLCRPVGIEVSVLDEVPAPPACAGGPLSSTEIRRRLRAGDVAGAACLLGRPHAVEGVVVRGAGRGRALGFPTANVARVENALPAPGIYAGALRVRDRGADAPLWVAAISLGRNPTFEGPGAPLVLEVHALDADVDLYGAPVEVAFVQRLRDEQAFPSADALVRQIRDDVARTRACVDVAALAEVWPP